MRPPQNEPTPPTEAELDAISGAEDKRRRNTAASGKLSINFAREADRYTQFLTARFRIKKKHKTLALERSVADLEERAEDLEREAADLRRENGWLKEMLIMKGRRRNIKGQSSNVDRGGTEDASDEDSTDDEGQGDDEEEPENIKKSRKGKERE